MKKHVLYLLGGMLLVLVVTAPAWAKSENAGASQGGSPDTAGVGQPTNVQVQNQNQTQNQGEDVQLQNQYQEQEAVSAGQGASAGQGSAGQDVTGVQTQSRVAQKVQAMQQVATRQAGQVGQQLQQMVQEQEQSQERVQEHKDSVEQRSGFTRTIFGPNYQAMKRLKGEVTANQNRITQAQELLSSLSSVDQLVIQDYINSLTAENSSLLATIQEQEATPGILGWLFKLLYQYS